MPRPYVIVADDEESWRELISRWLKTADSCDVEILSRGKDVLPAVAKRRPDLCILDYDLGDTTGIKICAALKADRRYASVPVIVLTAMSFKMPKTFKSGKPDHFLSKSGESAELMNVVDALLNGRVP